MKRLLSQTLDFLALQLRLRHPQVAWRLQRCQGARGNFARSNGSVVLKDTGLVVDKANAPLLAGAGSMMRRLTSRAGARWKRLPEVKVEAQVQNLSFEVS